MSSSVESSPTGVTKNEKAPVKHIQIPLESPSKKQKISHTEIVYAQLNNITSQERTDTPPYRLFVPSVPHDWDRNVLFDFYTDIDINPDDAEILRSRPSDGYQSTCILYFHDRHQLNRSKLQIKQMRKDVNEFNKLIMTYDLKRTKDLVAKLTKENMELKNEVKKVNDDHKELVYRWWNAAHKNDEMIKYAKTIHNESLKHTQMIEKFMNEFQVKKFP